MSPTAPTRSGKRLRRATGSLLMCVCAMVLGGCRAEMSDGEAPPLLTVSAERFSAHQASVEEKRSKFRKVPRDPYAFVSEAMIAGYISDCQVEQTGTPLQKKEVEAKGSPEDLGLRWRGGGAPLELSEAPSTTEFNWIEGDSEFLDPNRISESAGNALASQMFEPLLAYAAGNTPPVPGMAKSYDVSADGRTYTFHLREGLVWSDGTPLTAEDFRFSWLRGISPELGSRNAQQIWSVVKGAKAYNLGRTTDPNDVAIRVPDPLTLEVELNEPTSYFPYLVAYIAYAPVPRHTIEAHGDRWTRPENIVVNGPYKVVEHKPRSKMVFEANDRYWDTAHVQIKRHTAYLSDSEQANATYYLNGQVHTAQPLPQAMVKEWMKRGVADLHVAEQMAVYYYVYRVDKPPFNNRLVRRAFNMALDKERLTSHILSGQKTPARGLLPDMFRDSMGYLPTAGDAFDRVGARTLLAQAGYPGGAGLDVELIYNTYEAHRVIAEFYQQSIRANLGVTTSVSNMEWKSLLKKCQSGDFEVARTSWIADYPDPMTFLGVWHSESENNYAGYKNPAYDTLLQRIRRTTERATRNDLICAAEKVLNEDLPISPFYFYTRPYVIHPSVQGFLPQHQDHHLIKYISFRE